MPPLTKICKNDPSHTFLITDEDQAFYEKMNLPHPTFCPDCRQQRRFCFRNERFLYNRKCDITGKQIISQYPSDVTFPVYDVEAWYSDTYDPPYADYDFSQSFFKQLYTLQQKTPRLSVIQEGENENSVYTNAASNNKNCYLLFSGNYNEDCFYGTHINNCRNSLDGYGLLNCELCYECIDCDNCYHLRFSQNCITCTDSAFLKNCISCKDCLFCQNLRQKQYCINNKQLSKEEYNSYIKKLLFTTNTSVQKYKEAFRKWSLQQIHPYYFGKNNENSVGNYINNTKNCYAIYECKNVEDLRYCVCIINAKDCMDYNNWGRNVELVYETQACGYHCQNIKFCNLVWEGCVNLEYCDHCFSCQDCFGCVGLKKKQYCILNKQYSKEEYEELTKRIKQQMLKQGEYGEFFPYYCSTYGYNETVAQEYYILTKEEAEKLKVKWKDEDVINRYEGTKVTIPDSIKDVKNDIVQQILTCNTCQKNYKLIIQELHFYQKMGIPIPKNCPDCRHKKRLALRNPRKLWDRNCMKCGVDIKTSYSAERKEIVYCEECYNKTIY